MQCPWIKAKSLHFNHILMTSFQILGGGIHGQNCENCFAILILIDLTAHEHTDAYNCLVSLWIDWWQRVCYPSYPDSSANFFLGSQSWVVLASSEFKLAISWWQDEHFQHDSITEIDWLSYLSNLLSVIVFGTAIWILFCPVPVWLLGLMAHHVQGLIWLLISPPWKPWTLPVINLKRRDAESFCWATEQVV